MKLTPLDIHHKEFRHSLRGYNEEEVDQFLDQVADEFERLFKENIDLNERLDALQNKVNEFELQRQTINNTLMTAQRSADDIVARSEKEGEDIIAHANLRAKEIVNDALSEKQQVRGELLRIKQAEEEFRGRYRALLEENLRAITQVAIADDVNALLGEVDEAPVKSTAAPAPAPQALEHTPVEYTFDAPRVEPEPAPQAVIAPEAAEVLVAQSESSPEPPAPGFVQAVTLGEIEPADVPADVDLVEPSEFSLPGFAAFGEREDDVDIEEID